MVGLILKDLYNLKQQTRIYLLIVAIWVVCAIINKEPSFFSSIICTFTLLIPISTMAYDEKSKWNRFALTTPLSRLDIVVSKYILLGIIALFLTGISVLVNVILIKDITTSVLLPVIINCCALIVTSIILPVIFKFGVEKGRLLMMIVVLAPLLLLVFIPKIDIGFISSFSYESFCQILVVVVPIITVLLFFISMFVSYKLYKNKEY